MPMSSTHPAAAVQAAALATDGIDADLRMAWAADVGTPEEHRDYLRRYEVARLRRSIRVCLNYARWNRPRRRLWIERALAHRAEIRAIGGGS